MLDSFSYEENAKQLLDMFTKQNEEDNAPGGAVELVMRLSFEDRKAEFHAATMPSYLEALDIKDLVAKRCPYLRQTEHVSILTIFAFCS